MNIDFHTKHAHALKSEIANIHPIVRHNLVENCMTWDLIVNQAGKAIYCSGSCKKITGYPPEMFLNNMRCLEKIIHRKDKAHCPQFMCNNQTSDIQKKEYRILISTGEVKWIVSYIKPLLLCGWDHPLTLVSSFDITSYREQEIQLRQQNETLRRRNKDLVRQLSIAYRDIEYSKKKLLEHNKHLGQNNQELLETNNALKMLAMNLDSIKKHTEKKLIDDIYKNIYPLVSKLKNADAKTSRSRLVDNVLCKLDEYSRTLGGEKYTHLSKSLTATEFQVAALIRENLQSNQIARELKITISTVKTHRKNIRRKFNIQNSGANLANYLKLKWPN